MSGASPAVETADPRELAAKRARLAEILAACESVVIGYSGGVDSAYLAKAAFDVLGRERVLAVTGLSPSYPAVQRELARRVAAEVGFPHLEIETEEWADPRYVANPTNRCYFCKTELFDRLCALADARGYAVVCDGANADDRADFRPGSRAARERGVRSPLQEAELTKAEIRALSRAEGLPTWDVPAAPCLASRVAYGIAVTRGRLAAIERAEDALRAIRAWRHLRVRDHGDLARLEVDAADLTALADPVLRARAARAIHDAGFVRVTLDLEGYRRGSLHERALVRIGERQPNPAPDDLRIERCGTEGEVALLTFDSSTLNEVLRDGEGRRTIAARARSAGARFVAAPLAWDAAREREEGTGADEALRRAEPSGG